MTASGSSLCRHCLLPVRVRALQQTINGESCVFCCYGCSIAFQVKNGKTEEWEAAWLLIRLGIGGFLSMNIMLFSLLIYGGVFTGPDARMLPIIRHPPPDTGDAGGDHPRWSVFARDFG